MIHRIDQHFLRVLQIVPYFPSHIVAFARDFETLPESPLGSIMGANSNVSVQNYRKLPDTLMSAMNNRPLAKVFSEVQGCK